MTWDNGLGAGNNLSVSPAVTTTYRVVLSDNCSVANDTDEVTVTVGDPLSVTANPTGTKICFGEKYSCMQTAAEELQQDIFIPGTTE